MHRLLLSLFRFAASGGMFLIGLYAIKYAYTQLFPLFFVLDEEEGEVEPRFSHATSLYISAMTCILLIVTVLSIYVLTLLWGEYVSVTQWWQKLLELKVQIGSDRSSYLDIYRLAALLTTAFSSIPLSLLIRSTVIRPLIKIFLIQPGSAAVLERFWHYVLVCLFWAIGLYAIGLGQYLWQFVLVTSFAITLGIKDIILDVFSGAWLLFERSIEPTHFIEIGGLSGVVLEIGVRKTLLQTDRAIVALANRNLVNANLINWSKIDYRIGIKELKIQLKLGADFAKIQSQIIEILKKNNKVYSPPQSSILIDAVSSSGVTLIVRLALKRKYFSEQAAVISEFYQEVANFLEK